MAVFINSFTSQLQPDSQNQFFDPFRFLLCRDNTSGSGVWVA